MGFELYAYPKYIVNTGEMSNLRYTHGAGEYLQLTV